MLVMDLGKFSNVNMCKSRHFIIFNHHLPFWNPDIRVNSQIKDLNFFSCVLKDTCLIDVLTVKNNNVEAFIRDAAEQSTCPDTDMVCCHDLNKKEIPDESISEEQNQCQKHSEIGYR